VGLLVLFASVFTALPQTLFSASFKNLSVTTVSIISTLQVFYGALFGYLIHGETVTLRTVLGGLLILTCVIIETIRKASPRDVRASPTTQERNALGRSRNRTIRRTARAALKANVVTTPRGK